MSDDERLTTALETIATELPKLRLTLARTGALLALASLPTGTTPDWLVNQRIKVDRLTLLLLEDLR